jgi:hypothetical protein
LLLHDLAAAFGSSITVDFKSNYLDRCAHEQAEAALRQAEVARWAAAAPAPRPRPPSGDPAALLRRLQLGRKGAPVQAPAAQLPGGLQQVGRCATFSCQPSLDLRPALVSCIQCASQMWLWSTAEHSCASVPGDYLNRHANIITCAACLCLGAQEALLAHSFLRELRKGNAPGGGVAAWGARLAAALLAGGGSEGARTGDVNAQARVGAQVAGLGRALFLDGQLPALLPLLRLAGPAAEEPGLQFLQVGVPAWCTV